MSSYEEEWTSVIGVETYRKWLSDKDLYYLCVGGFNHWKMDSVEFCVKVISEFYFWLEVSCLFVSWFYYDVLNRVSLF